MKLHTAPGSPSGRKVQAVILHLKLDVQVQNHDFAKGELRAPEYLALNPNGSVPTLVDGAFVLWESNAIMQYLSDLTPGQTIYPTELRPRADVNRWLFWSAQHWSPALGVLTWERWMKGLFGMGTEEPREVERGNRDFSQFARVLDDHLGSRQWVSGPALTIADFSIATPLMRVTEASIPLQQYAHIASWFDRVQALEAWKKTVPT